MVRYIKCPRCELNYIDAEKQKYCDVCLKEMKGIPSDMDEIDEEDEAELATELCPVCGENMMRPGEAMCEECKRKMDYAEEPVPEEDDDEWREYLDDDTDADLDSQIGEIDEAFDEEFDEPEEEPEEFPDLESTAEYVPLSRRKGAKDDDDDEDEEKEEDEDEDDDDDDPPPRRRRIDFGRLQFGRDYEIK